MAGGWITDDCRKRLAKRFTDGIDPIPKIFYVAFGNEGHNPDRTPKAKDTTILTLNNELMRKLVSSVIQEDLFSTTGTGQLEKADLIGQEISEAGLLDEDGNLLAFKFFAPHTKDSDEEYETSVKLKF